MGICQSGTPNCSCPNPNSAQPYCTFTSNEPYISPVDDKDMIALAKEWSMRTGNPATAYPLLKHARNPTENAWSDVIIEAVAWAIGNNANGNDEWPGWKKIDKEFPGWKMMHMNKDKLWSMGVY